MSDYLLPRLTEILEFPIAVFGTVATLVLFMLVLYVFVSLPYMLLQKVIDKLEGR